MRDNNTYTDIEKKLSELMREQNSAPKNSRHKNLKKPKKNKTPKINNILRLLFMRCVWLVLWGVRVVWAVAQWGIRGLNRKPKSPLKNQHTAKPQTQNTPKPHTKIRGKIASFNISFFSKLWGIKNKTQKKQGGKNMGNFKPLKAIKWGGICAGVIGVTYGAVGVLTPVVKSLLSPKFGLGDYEYQYNQGGDYQLAILGLSTDTQYDNVSLNTPFVVDYVIKSGDSLVNILTAYNVGNRTATINAMNKVFPVRSVAVGQKLKLGIIGGDTPYEMASVVFLELEVNKEKSIFVKWDKDTNTYTQKIIKRKLTMATKQQAGDISLSLYVAMSRAGVNQPTIGNFINLFSFDTDFQRDIYKGDSFDIRYQEYMDEQGEFVKAGDILVAELSTLGGNRKRYYYYTDSKGKSDYYDYKGKSGRKFLMKTPIEGARLSSSFGKRKHPILGYTKMHRGTDFAAPIGTPIFAAGDGIIERAGRFGSFGIYIRIRHNGQYKTAYAHMKGIARGVRTGTRVKQGQVIGYVGTTGRSTGPHLHYEVIKNGVHVNSRTLKLPSGTQLRGTELAKFEQQIKPYIKNGL